jgi:DNA polymerase I-like protein with 3'-5' exonuclease and polymerase domains
MPIQGSAADIIKIAMLNIPQLSTKRDDLRMILQVHDELVFEVHKSTLDEAEAWCRGCMEKALPRIWRNVVQLKTDWEQAKTGLRRIEKESGQKVPNPVTSLSRSLWHSL